MASAFVKRSAAIVCWLGAILVIIGGWMQEEDSFRYLAEHFSVLDIVLLMAYLLIAVGSLIILVAALGWAAHTCDSICLIRGYFALLFLIGIALLGVGVWALVAKSYFQNMSVNILKKAVKNYGEGGTNQKILDSVQKKLDCCGATQGVEDFLSRNKTIPETCKPDFYETPCAGPFYEWLEQKLNIVGGLCLGIDGLLVLSIFLAWSLDNREDTERIVCNMIRCTCSLWCNHKSAYHDHRPI